MGVVLPSKYFCLMKVSFTDWKKKRKKFTSFFMHSYFALILCNIQKHVRILWDTDLLKALKSWMCDWEGISVVLGEMSGLN